LLKIQHDNDKAQRVQLEKSALLEQRKQIQAQMRSEKEELMRKFEVIQKTGKIPQDLVEKIGKDRLDSLNNTKVDSSTLSPDNTLSKSPNSTLKKQLLRVEPKPKLQVQPKEQVHVQPVVQQQSPSKEESPQQEVEKQHAK